MGANAQTTVPTFTAGQVLTADQQNQSARTGVPVFATSVERDAAFGGAGEKTLAEGQLAYLEDSNIVQYYDGSSWATVGPSATPGLELVNATTIGAAVSSVTITSVFSATYDNYRLVCNHTSFSTSSNVLVQLGTGTATTTNYNGYIRTAYNPWGTATPANAAVTNAFQATSSAGLETSFSMDIFAPNLAQVTYAGGHFANQTNGGYLAGRQTDATQFTSLHISVTAGTMTGGTIRVYGYKN